TIDPDTYAAKLKGRPLDLTYKEFELLKFLAQHPGRVFTRDQLLREVWGYDYFGGTRTVDVHVRRLRAKLGSEYESMIGTVRQVGYKFVAPPSGRQLPDNEPVSLPVAAGDGPLRFWAHGDEPAAQAFALRHGFARARVLWQMRRPLSGALPATPLPEGVTLRGFRPGRDEQDWLRVNARAFEHHPE